mmetsp:Transcript_77577/g.203680  ORF Transcript_77577/g.203680 Transcript_77577/m.203680 type:complete len:101 (-) Transcript_77577:68-370(-)
MGGDKPDMASVAIGFGLVAAIAFLRHMQPRAINDTVKKDCEKCVDFCVVSDVEELKAADGKLVFCRCWKSKKFPYCDGAHAAHNKLTGDNVGPLIVKANK